MKLYQCQVFLLIPIFLIDLLKVNHEFLLDKFQDKKLEQDIVDLSFVQYACRCVRTIEELFLLDQDRILPLKF